MPPLKNYIATKSGTLAICLATLAASASAQTVGTVTNVNGPLVAHRANGVVKVLTQQSTVEQGDLLETARNTYARILFIDNAEVTLRPDTQLSIDAYSYEADRPDHDRVALSLINGGMRSVTGLLGQRSKDKFKLTTPTGDVAIRGTNFGALFCQSNCANVPTTSGTTPQNGLYVDVTQGAVVLTNNGGNQEFQAGQFGFIANINSPPMVIPPAQGVPVTMPMSITQNSPSTTTSNQGDVDCIVR